MKRILFMHQVSAIGGASYCMLAVLRGLDREKFEPIVMLRQDGVLADEVRSLGIEVVFLPNMPTVPYNQSLLYYRTLYTYIKVEITQKKFAKKLRSLNIDTVYFNNMMLYPYLKTAKQVGCRTIIHVREHWPKEEHQYQMSRARRYVRHYADAVIAINHYSASMFPECRTKMQIIYDWIDIEKRYEKRSFSDIFGVDSENLKVLLFTGGLGRIKGTYEVVKTFTDEIQGAEYRLLMMGSGLDYRLQGVCGKIKKIMMITGWKPYGYRVMEQIKKDDRIICISPTYNMVDFYRQAYCTLSYFTIPHANLALAEAVSLGTVAIAAMTEEALEYTNNGRGAVLFNINDKDDFSAKIRYVLANYENVKEKTLQNSSAVRKRFSPDRNIRKLNQVCEDVSYNGNTLQNKRIN